MSPANRAKALVFFSNVTIWLVLSIFVQLIRAWNTGSSLLARLSPKDNAVLTNMADYPLLLQILAACALLSGCMWIAGRIFAVPEAKPDVQAVLRNYQSEAASVLLNFGSLCFAATWWIAGPGFFLGALAAWLGWLLLYPKQ
ncbi:hypothetical protein [Comamonas odontotermitis]|uniref:hypothetical protein n=1 Tax=Comamonas odontotermitis TaxID=379895 RepID=UPI00374FE9AE